jgi:hypothetical protein
MATNNKPREQKKNPADQTSDSRAGTGKRSDAAAQRNNDEMEAEKLRTRKPGSQSNSSKQGNNGRGGGK